MIDAKNKQALMQLPYKDAKRVVLDSFEREYFAGLIEKHHGNLSAASRDAALSRRHLRSLLRRYDLYTPPVNDERRQFLTHVSGVLLAVPVVAKLAGCGRVEDDTGEWDGDESPMPPGGGSGPADAAESFEVVNDDDSGHLHSFEIKCSHRDADGWVYTAGGGHTHTVALTAKDLDAVFSGTAVTIETTDGHPHTWVIRLPDGAC